MTTHTWQKGSFLNILFKGLRYYPITRWSPGWKAKPGPPDTKSEYSSLVSCGAAAQRWPWPPRSWGFLITYNDASQSVGLHWTSDELVAETSTWQHTTLTTDKHPCLRWDSNPRSSRRAVTDLRLRPRGHWDRHSSLVTMLKILTVHSYIQYAGMSGPQLEFLPTDKAARAWSWPPTPILKEE